MATGRLERETSPVKFWPDIEYGVAVGIKRNAFRYDL